MPTGNMLKPWPLLAGYICLAGGAFALWVPILGLLPLPVLPCAFVARRIAMARQDVVAAEHARWQLRTFWLLFMLLVGLMGLFAAVGIVFSDAAVLDLVEAIGNAYSANQIDVGVVLERFWGIGEIRYFTWAGLFWLTLAQVWPLKRIIQGIWALFAGCVPTGPGGGVKCLALVVAFAVQGGILAFILGT